MGCVECEEISSFGSRNALSHYENIGDGEKLDEISLLSLKLFQVWLFTEFPLFLDPVQQGRCI